MTDRTRQPVIVGAARTPIGRFLGGLAPLSAPELGAIAIRAALTRSGLDPARVQEVIMGQVLQGGAGQAPARQAMLRAGVPATASAMTINKVCGSGLQAVMLAAQAIVRLQWHHDRAALAGHMHQVTHLQASLSHVQRVHLHRWFRHMTEQACQRAGAPPRPATARSATPPRVSP